MLVNHTCILPVQVAKNIKAYHLEWKMSVIWKIGFCGTDDLPPSPEDREWL